MTSEKNSTLRPIVQPQPIGLDTKDYILIAVSALATLVALLFGVLWCKTRRSLIKTKQQLRQMKTVVIPSQDPSPRSAITSQDVLKLTPSEFGESHGHKSNLSTRLLSSPSQQIVRISKADLNLTQLIKAGREGAFYKAKMMQGTCKGHSFITCKIAKEGITSKQIEAEVSIMKKLVYHKNVLQLLDWNVAEEPFILIMEFVSYGTLRNFLQAHREKLSADPEIQNLFTIASYHIALAMQHLRSKMVVHCDLALRNILVNRFPGDVKVTEFGLARDLTRMRSRYSSKKKQHRDRVPVRWYPPEYFRNNYYSFKGDVWAFGVLLWEMQTFGSLPYPHLETAEQVVVYICSGQRNAGPDGCRPEILQLMKDCWLEPYTSRPSFTDLVQILATILETELDYVNAVTHTVSAEED